jgi:Zn-finger protein
MKSKTTVEKSLEPNCGCEKYYKNELFEGNCSSCYAILRPEKYKEFMKLQNDKSSSPRFTHQELWDYTDKHAISYYSQYITVLKQLFATNSWQTDENLRKFITHTKKKTSFKGIRAEQGAELMTLYLKTNHGGSFPPRHTQDKNGIMFWKIEHVVAGMIVDYWNITSGLHGGCANCYYGNFGDKPINKNKQGVDKCLEIPPAFQSNASSKKIFEKIKFWITNTPPSATGGIEFFNQQ